MKHLFISLLLLIVAIPVVFGQGSPGDLPGSIKTASQSVSPTATQNYVVSYTYLEPKTSHSDSYKAGETAPVVEYFDGLGRPMQTVSVKETVTGKDLLTYQDYDAFGRPLKSYLPYAKSSNNGAFLSETSFIFPRHFF